MKKAVILLSGGLDSATCLAVAISEGFECVALSFDYGQRHGCELQAARRVAAALGAARHHVLKLDLRLWGGSALTSDDLAVPDFGTHGNAIPVTYVPARNLMFLSCAAACAEAENARDIFIGVNSLDYSGYPDCRPEFIRSFAETARLGTKACDEGWKFEIHAPLQYLTKAEIIRKGAELGVDYSITHSCYNPSPGGLACGRCDSCKLRQAGFAAANMPDPTIYGD